MSVKYVFFIFFIGSTVERMLLPVFVLHALNWLVASGSGKHRHEVPDGCHQAMSEQLLVAESDNHDSWLTFTTYCLCVQSHAQCEFQAGLVPMLAPVYLGTRDALTIFHQLQSVLASEQKLPQTKIIKLGSIVITRSLLEPIRQDFSIYSEIYMHLFPRWFAIKHLGCLKGHCWCFQWVHARVPLNVFSQRRAWACA